MVSATQKKVELFDWLSPCPFLVLPIEAVKEVGPATQTLAGLLALTKNTTFVKVDRIAEASSLPRRTCQLHLQTLAAQGWIENEGREKTATGKTRRTSTIRITARARPSITRWFHPVPYWAVCPSLGLKWSELLILALVYHQVKKMAQVCLSARNKSFMDGDIDWGDLENIGIDSNFRWSVTKIESETGLSRPSICKAKAWLHRNGFIYCQPCGHTERSIIKPRDDFQVSQTQNGDGSKTTRIFSNGREVKLVR